jgi:FkbM family methyltransferase
MSAREAVATYYGLFGVRGVLLAAKARSLRRSIETVVLVPGIKHPVYLRFRTSDVSVFRQVLVTKEYDCQFWSLPQTIIDAGANIGLTSVFYANKYPEATIIAIEPESSNFQMLRKNTAPYKNITAIQAALWKDNRSVTLVDPNLGHHGFRTVETSKTSIGHPANMIVPGLTLDKLMQEFNIDHVDILKLDIEGSEKEVFENSVAWIDNVGVIIVELHDELRVGCARALYLAARDFQVEWRKGETIFLARAAADAAPDGDVLIGTGPCFHKNPTQPNWPNLR